MPVEEEPTVDGLRARKRGETRQRIIDTGIALFVEHGFDATTIDAIAEASGISRRTFFHYFDTKDEVLLSLQSGMGEQIAERVRHAPAGARPLSAVRDAVIAVCAEIPSAEMIVIDRLMRASKLVQARKQASYVAHEERLFAALSGRWPEPERTERLRLVAMLAIGIVRLATDTFHRESGARPIQTVLRAGFDALDAELGG